MNSGTHATELKETTAAFENLAALVPLFREIGNLKRIRAADLFRRAWSEIVGGADAQAVAVKITSDAVIGANLGAIDRKVLETAELTNQKSKRFCAALSIQSPRRLMPISAKFTATRLTTARRQSELLPSKIADAFCDIESHLERKIRACAAYRSQIVFQFGGAERMEIHLREFHRKEAVNLPINSTAAERFSGKTPLIIR